MGVLNLVGHYKVLFGFNVDTESVSLDVIRLTSLLSHSKINFQEYNMQIKSQLKYFIRYAH